MLGFSCDRPQLCESRLHAFYLNSYGKCMSLKCSFRNKFTPFYHSILSWSHAEDSQRLPGPRGPWVKAPNSHIMSSHPHTPKPWMLKIDHIFPTHMEKFGSLKKNIRVFSSISRTIWERNSFADDCLQKMCCMEKMHFRTTWKGLKRTNAIHGLMNINEIIRLVLLLWRMACVEFLLQNSFLILQYVDIKCKGLVTSTCQRLRLYTVRDIFLSSPWTSYVGSSLS